MNSQQSLIEANVADKIKDPKVIKQITIAMRHDGTLPKHAVAKLGPRPSDQDTLALWSAVLDKALSNTQYGNISQDGKFDDWLTRLYINGIVDYEDIDGEGGDALGAWKALSLRGKLKPEHQDFNKFRSLKQIQNIVQNRDYRDELRKIQDAEVIEKHKRDKQEITILDDDRFLAVVPLNYGSCYTFNNAHGFNASFCTGSSSGHSWFNRYADDGPLVSIFDKQNGDDVNGKWQMHAPTNQLNNGNQQVRGDKEFNDRFPGLMKKIVAGLESNADDINKGSGNIVKGGYDMAKAVSDIKSRFPLSFASGEEEVDPEGDASDDTPGTWVVTHATTGRTARVHAENIAHVHQQLLQRHPDLNMDDFTFEKEPANEQP